MAAAVLGPLGKDFLVVKRQKGVEVESELTACVDVAGALWKQNLRSQGKLALGVLPQSYIHTSASLDISRKWEKKNKIVYPPQLPGEPRRPAEIYHCRRQIKYSKDKMWYLAKLIRGMSIDQALAQLEFNDKKGAKIIREVLLEAQDMAVRDHNVEFRSNLYIAESTSGRGQCLKRIRYHGKGHSGIMEKVYCHYFVKLVEGPPPPPEPPKTAVDHAKEYIQQLRNRTIIHTL
ncbi:PREDICTED: 39S ribosomal protein L22, mitochondrial isoform X1 [Colobus angolensis palliatus]|uniref:Large ribosomal subunit protein uL22m n=1 Tax=Colobus angolensis palliatus TaxID=336983 RepID=A0A2K5JTE0_COLAP|nr:PREDICTED: 39S ribosomal protein L22, mitochondrial isoform X1 [Colobus angolensis palliatus]